METLFKNLTKVLNDFGPKLIQEYQTELKNNGRYATGNLVNSLTYEVQWKGSLLELSISMEEYWKYIEDGTRPHFPPTNAILSWIKAKPIAPRPINGKLPTQEQLAFLIARKISREGTRGTNDLNKVEDSNWDRLLGLIDDALEKDISDSLDEIIEMVWK